MQWQHPPQYSAPTTLQTLREFSAPIDWLSIVTRAPKLMLAPRGDTRPVLLAPGYLTDESAMRPLQRYLDFLRYRTFGWGLGRNRGKVDEDIVLLGTRVAEIAAETNQPVTLIGWSLGGVVCREVARYFPEFVAEVITLASPIVGGPKYTAPGRRFAALRGLDLKAFEHEVHSRNSVGISQPVSSIYSEKDGIVHWRASVDIYNPHAQNILVHSTHLGFCANAQVWLTIARLLAGHSVTTHDIDRQSLLAGEKQERSLADAA